MQETWEQKTWAGRNVTILGLSKSGSAVARYIQKRGGQCFLSETLPATPGNEALRKELEALGVDVEMGGHSKKCFTHSDLVIASPGIPPSSSIMNELRMSGKEIISEVELAYRETLRHSPQIPIIAITGTNGKTTTTTLISEILTRAGLNAPTCGNIGRPLLDVLDAETRPDYLVAELSSFQIELSPTLKAKVAVFTNFKPDHLDWHGSVDAYERAKLKLFSGAQSPEWSVLLGDDPVCRKVSSLSTGNTFWFSRDAACVSNDAHAATLTPEMNILLKRDGQADETLLNVRDLKIIGQHNYENVLAASTVARLLGVSPEVIAEACLAFEGVEHRLERVSEIGGTVFYNDSKATNPDATLSALRAFDGQKVILIAGGRDKHGPLDEFVREVKDRVQSVILIGEASQRFNEALRNGGYTAIEFCETLDLAVVRAKQLSDNEPVLFSPACASFDMFKNFEERGKVFKTLVLGLKNTLESSASQGVLTP